jgi:hypothetical protein
MGTRTRRLVQIAIRQGEPINASALKQIFQQIIANNRAGGWRRVKAAGAS